MEPERFCINDSSLEIHDLERPDPRCHHDKIKARRFFAKLSMALKAGGNPAFWCLREWSEILSRE